MKLLIVESPTKAKTITRFLPKDFVVESSLGHIRDLPKKKLSIDVENNFEPTYEIMPDKIKHVAALKKIAKKADEIYLATDEDREGEAISWHLAFILDLKPKEIKRIAFHEITKKAILAAMEHPRALDMHLIDAQQARRVLDRLVGYELSPFLWKKVTRGLSAGRVQSVAVRLIVEREREIRAFIPQEFWSIDAIFSTNNAKEQAEGSLFQIDQKKLDKFEIANEQQARDIVNACSKKNARVSSVEQKTKKRHPSPPFTTSTLQQSAHNRYGYSAKQIMRLAQQLYEGAEIKGEGSTGLITYMRTDSTALSQDFIESTRSFITSTFSKKYISPEPRVFASQSKNAQEAHEAIRPTDISRTPDSLKGDLSDQQWKLYDLIWRRACATQMSASESQSTTIIFSVDGKDEHVYDFKAVGSVITFDGFLKVYPEQLKDRLLPHMKEGEEVNTETITPNQHFTEPPPRYNDASLVKILEEYGIGRPSTFAPTIATIEARGYVIRQDRKQFAPTDIGEVVNDVLVEHFPNIVDYEFTANMETQLDEVASGTKQWQPIIEDFYDPFKDNLMKKTEEVKRSDVMTQETEKKCPTCEKPIIIRVGRYGKFYACSGYPACKYTEPLEGEKKKKEPPKPIGVACMKCKNGQIVERKSRKGKIFYGCDQFPACDFALWGMPLEEACGECGNILMLSGKTKVKCSNKECTFTRKKTEDDDAIIQKRLAVMKMHSSTEITNNESSE